MVFCPYYCNEDGIFLKKNRFKKIKSMLGGYNKENRLIKINCFIIIYFVCFYISTKRGGSFYGIAFWGIILGYDNRKS